MKFKEFHLKDARASHLKIQCSKDCLSSPQQWQYMGQSSETLPILIAIVLYLYPQRKRIIHENPKLNWGYFKLSIIIALFFENLLLS